MAGSPSIAVKVLADLKGFTTAVSGAGSNVQGAASKMRTAFSGVTGALNQTGVLGPFSATLDGIGSGLDALDGKGKSLSKTFIGVGTAAAGVGAGLTAFGSKDQAAMQQLQQAVENTGASYEDFGKSVEEAISHQEKFGHTANETEDALRLLTNATHDPQKALDLLGEASDIAASKHEDLSTAATQLGKVYNGNTKLLKEYGITIDKTTGLTKDGKTAVQALADVTGGQASQAADTFTGKLDGMKAHLEDQVALFGQKYGPAILAAGVGIDVLGSAATAAGAGFTAMGIGEGVALAPLLLVTLAVVAAYIAVVVLYQKWDEVWKAIGTMPWYAKVALAIAVITNPVLLLIFVITLLGVYWDTIWKAIAAVAKWVWENILQPVFDNIATKLKWLWDKIHDYLLPVAQWILDKLAGPFLTAWDIIKQVAGWIIDKVGELVGKLGDLKDAFGGLHLPTGPVTGIPLSPFAEGGIVTHPTLALIGEAGPEAVIPLNQLGSGGRSGPVVNIENAHFHDQVDVDLVMRRVAWTARTQAV